MACSNEMRWYKCNDMLTPHLRVAWVIFSGIYTWSETRWCHVNENLKLWLIQEWSGARLCGWSNDLEHPLHIHKWSGAR